MENEVFRMLLRSSKKYIPVEPYTYLKIIPDENVIITKENNFFGPGVTFDYCIVNNKKLIDNIKLKQNKLYDIYVHLYKKYKGVCKIPNYTIIFDESKENVDIDNRITSCSSNKIDTVIIKRLLGYYVFKNKTTLKSVTIYNTCTNILDGNFSGCNNLEYFNYVGTPQDWAYVSTYTNINQGYYFLPSSYTKIKFNNKTLIPDIIFDKNKTKSSVSLFDNIDLNIFDSGLLEIIDNYMFNRSNINKFILRDSITTLKAFSILSNITDFEFHINHTIKVIDNAFYRSGQHITNLNIISEDNDLGCLAYLFNDQHGSPIQNKVINPILVNDIICKKATTPDDVTKIGHYAFSYLSQLEEVIVSDSVITVMNNMCYKSNVKHIKYGNSVKTIGINCSPSSLEIIDFGESIENIGEGSIAHATSIETEILKVIVIRNPTPPTITENTIRYIHKDVPFYVPAEAINTYETTEFWNLFTNILPLSEYDYNDYK